MTRPKTPSELLNPICKYRNIRVKSMPDDAKAPIKSDTSEERKSYSKVY